MLPDQLHTYAIAEVNGDADLLRDMLAVIDRFAKRMALRYRIVFIGDIIGRGPHSRQAMDIVSQTILRLPGSQLILGDQEVQLLRILDETEWVARQSLLLEWISDMHGNATLNSYGFSGRPSELDSLKQMIGRDHVSVLRRAVRFLELDRHVLVHAGVDPGIGLRDQKPERMLHTLSRFLEFTGSNGKIIVHGGTATPSGLVEAFPNRIAINTSTRLTRKLSALHIDPDGKVHAIEVERPVRGATIIRDYALFIRKPPEPVTGDDAAIRPRQGPPILRKPPPPPKKRGRPPKRRRKAKAASPRKATEGS